jgi:hypothetical protein
MNTATQTEETNKVTLQDLKDILCKMDFYKRTAGFIAHDLSGKLTFFDAEPSFGGAYVTREDILEYINEY